ncbi:MAG: hypothetical protein M1823_005707 [Watsoniomyces obsoletus]|nr:MAG: hypothetical protein M1823_005707 [Watsoniomyces obsoletus]
MAKQVVKGRDRKEKRRNEKNNKDKQGRTGQDSNATELLPVSKVEKAAEKRQKLQEFQAQQPRVSKKKQKRLETYLARKLRKDENLDLIKKLAEVKVDTSLLKSSKTLGRIRETKKEHLLRLAKQQKAGLVGEGSLDEGIDEEEEETDLNTESDDGSEIEPEDQLNNRRSDVAAIPKKLAPREVVLGSGLKRPLRALDTEKPVVTEKRRKTTHADTSLSGSLAEDAPKKIGGVSLKNQQVVPKDDQESPESSSDGEEGQDSELSDSSNGEHEDGDDVEASEQKPSDRISSFRTWAETARNVALGYQPVAPTIQNMDSPSHQSAALAPPPRHDRDQEPLPAELEIKDSEREVFSIHVERDPQIQEQRLALPVVMEEQKIMEAIHHHPTVVICGATGSGKTTQIPQFLYEAGYGSPKSPNPGLIGITQPRRVAAVSMAKRVAMEMGKDADRVAYKIRFEGNVGPKTSIKFMTDGILLREASEDIALRKYSVIIIDEAHEMSKDTSILIGMMSRIIKLRERLAMEDPSIRPLKLIIMSATLVVKDIIHNQRLFPSPPPVVNVEGRQFPVTVHWNRRTTHDYLDEVFRKVHKAHRTLPAGAMLVFLTGQNEILTLSDRLKRAFLTTSGRNKTGPTVRLSGEEAPMETEDMESAYPPVESAGADLDNLSSDDRGSSDDQGASDYDVGWFDVDSADSVGPVHVLPLYSLLPTSEQMRVFEPPPTGSRLIVLATNIAETSLTIPGIRYVFDCGRAKERKYNDETGIQSFEVNWISKASANQRAGRAGRTGPGHCYRLYSSAVYERDFEEATQPEIQRTPLEGVVLQLLGLDVPRILEKFPFPTPPDPFRLAKAKNLLGYLGAISKSDQITELGRKMSALPLLPRFSKILLTGHGYGCLPYTIALVAALSVPDLFVEESIALSALSTPGVHNAVQMGNTEDEARTRAYRQAQARFAQLGGDSDALKMLAAVLAHAAADDPIAFCAENFIRLKAMREAQLLRRQLSYLLRADPTYTSMLSAMKDSLPSPTPKQVKYLKQVVASGFTDQVAIRADLAPNPPDQPRKPKRATTVPYLPLFPSSLHHEDEKAVYIHPSSQLARLAAGNVPDYIIYWKLQRSANTSKVRMHPLTPVSALQLAGLTQGTPLQENGKPIKEVITNDVDGLKRVRWVVPTLRGSTGSQGWPLPARKVVQIKENGIWVDKS